MRVGDGFSPSFSQSFNLPKNIIWRQSVKTATTENSEQRKNYRIFNKQQQYQEYREREWMETRERMNEKKTV
jgi:hypothetical protein